MCCWTYNCEFLGDSRESDIFHLLFRGNQVKVEGDGAGLGPYFHTAPICGWDAPPSSPTEAEANGFSVSVLRCVLICLQPAPVLESGAHGHVRMPCVGTAACPLSGILKNQHMRATEG